MVSILILLLTFLYVFSFLLDRINLLGPPNFSLLRKKEIWLCPVFYFLFFLTLVGVDISLQWLYSLEMHSLSCFPYIVI